MCEETGEVFESIGAAAQSIDRAIQSLCACLNGRQKTCGGYHWRYLETASCE